MAAANRDWEGGMGRWGEEEVQDHTSVRGSNRGRKDLGYPPPPPKNFHNQISTLLQNVLCICYLL